MISNSFTYRLAVLSVLAAGILAVSHVGGSARQAQDDPVAEVPASEARSLDEMAWVDPIVTGPVSPAYKRLREQANCDAAVWPDIPDICFPR